MAGAFREPPCRGGPSHAPINAPEGAHVFRRNGRNGQHVYLFDMKHGLCVLSHEAVAAEPMR